MLGSDALPLYTTQVRRKGQVVRLCSAQPEALCFPCDVLITACQTERFLFRATSRNGGLNSVMARLDAARRELAERFDIPTDISINTVKRVDGKVQVIDITTTLRDILGKKARTVQCIEQRLLDFHRPLLLALQAG